MWRLAGPSCPLLLAAGVIACDPAAPARYATAAPALSASQADAGFVVMGATVFDGERFRTGNVHVVGANVAGFVTEPPPGARVVAGAGHTLMPGLIDGHAHVGDAAGNLTTVIKFGVTTVVDLFGPPELLAKMRATDVSPEGLTRASLVGAGVLATAPGGHGTEYGIPIPTIERPADAQAFVSARKAEGAMLLKIVYDNQSETTDGKTTTMPTLALGTVLALATEGHQQGLPVVVHAGTCEDIRQLSHLPVDVIAHGCALPKGDGLASALAQNKVFLNPTLAVQLRPCGMEYWIPIVSDPEIAARLNDEENKRLGTDRHDHNIACSEGRLRLVRESAKAGVRLIAGPDSPNRRLPLGASLLAEVLLLQEAGATIEQSLAAATSNPADAYRIAGRGRIAKGQRADLLLVAGDASRDLRAVLHTRSVWKAGALLR